MPEIPEPACAFGIATFEAEVRVWELDAACSRSEVVTFDACNWIAYGPEADLDEGCDQLGLWAFDLEREQCVFQLGYCHPAPVNDGRFLVFDARCEEGPGSCEAP